MAEYFVGLMSGTSMDGIDAALVDFSGKSPKLITALNVLWPPELHQTLLETRQLPETKMKDLDELDRQVGEQFASATIELLSQANIDSEDIIAIGSHGQTIRHQPVPPDAYSLQLGNAELIATKTGLPVISDFRSADIELGGQGAPLAPAFHNQIFRSREQDRIILNIGGIANITFLPSDQNHDVVGFDTGPGNTLMDVWIKMHHQKPYDEDGRWASEGKIDEGLLENFLTENYFSLSIPKSTGFELFNLDWVQHYLSGTEDPTDVQTTLCELSALTISRAIDSVSEDADIFLCGGGAHNTFLIDRLSRHLTSHDIRSTETLGVHPDWVEAMTFAWLAKQHIEGLPGNLPSVTGAKKATVLGISHPRP